MKKILFAATVYDHLSCFHKPFMKAFLDKGFEVHAIGNNSMGRKNELTEMGVICHDIEFDRLPFTRNNISAMKHLNQILKSNYFDLIHVHTPTAAFLTRFAASKHKQGKVLYTAHGFHFFKGAPLKNWLLFYPAEKLAVQWTDGLIVMNKEDYQSGSKLGFKEDKNIYKVHGVGVNLTEFRLNVDREEQDIRHELRLGNDSLIVSCIAELTPRKNQLFLLENWQAIVMKCPNAHLVFVGDGETEEKVKTFIKEKNLQSIHLLGYRSDIPHIISSSDIVTLVSKHEGLPRCLMEAMACGKPIITTNVRGSRDLVEHGRTGVIVELGDNKALEQGISKLLQSEQLRQQYGEQARYNIRNYSIEKVVDEMDKIYTHYLKTERRNVIG